MRRCCAHIFSSQVPPTSPTSSTVNGSASSQAIHSSVAKVSSTASVVSDFNNTSNAVSVQRNPFANLLSAAESDISWTIFPFLCSYNTAAYAGTCQFRCSTQAELELHQINAHPHRVLMISNLPPEIRNRIYVYVIPDFQSTFSGYPSSMFRGLLYENAGLNFLQTRKQWYREAALYLYSPLAFTVTGIFLSSLRLGNSADQARAHKARHSGYSSGLLKVNHDSNYRVLNDKNTLQLGHRMTKWTPKWVFRKLFHASSTPSSYGTILIMRNTPRYDEHSSASVAAPQMRAHS